MKSAANFIDRHAKWIFPLPALLAMLLLIVAPIVANVVLSTYNYFIGTAPSFAGLGNFREAFADARAWNGLRLTFYFTFLAVPIQLVLGFAIALLFNREFPGKGLVRTITLLPMVATPVAIALIWALMFNPNLGVLNAFLEGLGLPRSLWVADSNLVIPSLVLVDVWEWTPFIALILLAALQGVAQEYYEAARIDGASSVQSFWFITLPSIRSAVIVALILRSIDALKTFDIIYVITQGGPGTASETLNVYAFRTGFEFFRAGYAATLLILLMFVVLGVAVVFNLLRRRSA